MNIYENKMLELIEEKTDDTNNPEIWVILYKGKPVQFKNKKSFWTKRHFALNALHDKISYNFHLFVYEENKKNTNNKIDPRIEYKNTLNKLFEDGVLAIKRMF